MEKGRDFRPILQSVGSLNMNQSPSNVRDKYTIKVCVFPPYIETTYFLTQVNAHYLRSFWLFHFGDVLTSVDDRVQCINTTVYTLTCH